VDLLHNNPQLIEQVESELKQSDSKHPDFDLDLSVISWILELQG